MPALNSFYKSKYLWPVLAALAAIFVYSLWGRVPVEDDAWLGEHAYWLEKVGYVRSELFRGMQMQEDHFLVHHKLLTLHGALFIKLFGFSLYSLKAVSLLYFVFFILLFSVYTIRWKKLFNKEDLLFALIIVFSFTEIFKNAFIFRPEIMAMFYGFGGYILLEKYLDSVKPKLWLLIFSGLLFGLALFTHLNSLVLILAATALLIWNKKYLGVFIFSLATTFTSALYFYDFNKSGSIDFWIFQFFNSPVIDSLKDTPLLLKPLVNLAREHMRYFHNLEIIIFSTFLIVTLFVGFKFLYHKHTNLVRFALLTLFFTGLITMHKARHYLIPAFPYLLLMITLTIKAINEKKLKEISVLKNYISSYLYKLLVLLFIVFIVGSAYFNISLSLKKFSDKSNHLLTEKYAGSQASEMNIIAPMTFIFNEIKNYKRIQAELFYTEMKKSDPTIYGDGFLEKANDFDIDLILVSHSYSKQLGISDFQIGEQHGVYELIDKQPELMVFKRNSILQPEN